MCLRLQVRGFSRSPVCNILILFAEQKKNYNPSVPITSAEVSRLRMEHAKKRKETPQEKLLGSIAAAQSAQQTNSGLTTVALPAADYVANFSKNSIHSMISSENFVIFSSRIPGQSVNAFVRSDRAAITIRLDWAPMKPADVPESIRPMWTHLENGWFEEVVIYVPRNKLLRDSSAVINLTNAAYWTLTLPLAM